MGFDVSPEMKMILSTMDEFVREELLPLERYFLDHDFDRLMPLMDQKRRKAKDLGLWLPQIPAVYGGMGLTLLEHGLVSEVLGRSILGHYAFNCQAPDAGNMEILIEYGTDDQKEQFLKPLLSGEIRSCFSMTEPENPGSNPTWMSTTAVRSGEEYIIEGHKWFTSAADGAAFAIVMAVTDREASRHRRASMIIVPTETPGFRLVENTSVMGERGQGFASHAEIRYENCRVPASYLLGAEGEGFIIAQQRLGPGRIHHCMRWIGICERAFDLMCRQAVLREVAPGRPLAGQQTIQNWVVESRAEINSARLMVLDAAEKIDRQGTYAARDEISLIKFYVAGVLQRVLDRAVQVHGAMGMTDELPLAYWFRHERAARIYDGPDEVHKRSVARRIFESYR
ncbi:MAG: acyl-CoA dehydrogenase family protein [Candidatus Promineifilaceae bacterium]|nr:acyl-CoA dehydrogenase family protein [Candidatus Promineifilaceae bacterium]